jgi:hypothetical protein
MNKVSDVRKEKKHIKSMSNERKNECGAVADLIKVSRAGLG